LPTPFCSKNQAAKLSKAGLITIMNVTLREGTAVDIKACATICYTAFKEIAERHSFRPAIRTPEVAEQLINCLFSLPNITSLVAESDGQIIGSNFLWDLGLIAGIGPITVSPEAQDRGVGRRLMDAVMERAKQQKFAGVRFVQSGYNCRSISFYAKLGFDVREPLVAMDGTPPRVEVPGCIVRFATERDFAACNQLCFRIHDHDRARGLQGAIEKHAATVVEREGRITAYATGIGFVHHAVAEGNVDLTALIGAADEIQGPGFLLPIRNTELFCWCLAHGLRVVEPMMLMSYGLYNKPRGAFLPSIVF
jgi:predicted N-acetyltransferase YhbS